MCTLNYQQRFLMRILFLSLLLALFLQAEERYCIEVLSTKEKATITPELMEKVTKMRMPHSVKFIDGQYKVFLGKFDTREAAKPVLDEVRKSISEDAVISIYQEKRRASQLDPKAAMQQAMLMAQAKALSKTQESEEHNTSEHKTIEIAELQDENASVRDVKAEKKPVKIVITRKPKEKKEESFCKSSKKALREAEISEALEFYKNSSFYSFTD